MTTRLELRHYIHPLLKNKFLVFVLVVAQISLPLWGIIQQRGHLKLDWQKDIAPNWHKHTQTYKLNWMGLTGCGWVFLPTKVMIKSVYLKNNKTMDDEIFDGGNNFLCILLPFNKHANNNSCGNMKPNKT